MIDMTELIAVVKATFSYSTVYTPYHNHIVLKDHHIYTVYAADEAFPLFIYQAIYLSTVPHCARSLQEITPSFFVVVCCHCCYNYVCVLN